MATRRHGHCPPCQAEGTWQPAAITIDGHPAAPDPDLGCHQPGCPARGLSWACHQCGDAYFGTPPHSGLCDDCADLPTAA